jgi:hypothetical protein
VIARSCSDATVVLAAHCWPHSSSIDTVDCTRVCDELGADSLCTSVEEWPARGSLPTDEAIARLLPPWRPVVERQSHLVGSDANPGIVNASCSWVSGSSRDART